MDNKSYSVSNVFSVTVIGSHRRGTKESLILPITPSESFHESSVINLFPPTIVYCKQVNKCINKGGGRYSQMAGENYATLKISEESLPIITGYFTKIVNFERQLGWLMVFFFDS